MPAVAKSGLLGFRLYDAVTACSSPVVVRGSGGSSVRRYQGFRHLVRRRRSSSPEEFFVSQEGRDGRGWVAA